MKVGDRVEYIGIDLNKHFNRNQVGVITHLQFYEKGYYIDGQHGENTTFARVIITGTGGTTWVTAPICDLDDGDTTEAIKILGEAYFYG